MNNKNILIAIYGMLAILFFHTGVNKFLEFKQFEFDMNNQPFPNSFTPLLIWAIPLTELTIAGLFFIERARLVALYASLALMSLFTIYTAAVLLHSFDRVPCSCGGFVRWLGWKQHLVFNLFFVMLSAWGIRLYKKESDDEQTSHQIITT